MAAPYQITEETFTLPANADLSASQYCAVDVNSSGNAVVAGAGGGIVGVLQNNPAAAGRASEIQMGGVTPMKMGGTVAKGDYVKADASGRAVTASGADIAAGTVIGRCIVAGGTNEIGSVMLTNFGTGYVGAGTGVDDIVLGTTAPSNLTAMTFAQTTGTKTGVLGAGVYAGQTKDIVQSVAASTPVGTITGTFKTWAGAGATTLALGTAVGFIAKVVWDGAAWRQVSAIGGTGSSLT